MYYFNIGIKKFIIKLTIILYILNMVNYESVKKNVQYI